MAKRRAGSQIANLTPNHQKSRIALISLRASGVLKLWASKVTGISIYGISGHQLGNVGTK
jgi:hypothetical protein